MQQVRGPACWAASSVSVQLLAVVYRQSTTQDMNYSKARCWLVAWSKVTRLVIQPTDIITSLGIPNCLWVAKEDSWSMDLDKANVFPLLSCSLSLSRESCLSKWMIQSWAHEANFINNEIHYSTLCCACMACRVTFWEGIWHLAVRKGFRVGLRWMGGEHAC